MIVLALVKLASRWIARLSDREPRDLEFWIQYHQDQDLGELREFWSKSLGIHPEQVRFQRKSNSGKLAGRSWRSTHGVLTVRVGDTYLRQRLQAWMDYLQQEIWG